MAERWIYQSAAVARTVGYSRRRTARRLDMATTTFVPIETYLSTSYEPDAEYADGVIGERPMPEYDHSSWQGALLAFFGEHGFEWNFRALPELRVRVAKTRFRVPDVTVLDRNAPA